MSVTIRDKEQYMEQYTDTVLNETSGEDDKKDFARAIWYQLNWSDLVIPSPTAINIFGQLVLVAVITDFPLDVPKGKQFEHLSYAKFRSSVGQLRDAGREAFSCTYDGMDNLKKMCDTIQVTVKEIVKLLANGSGKDIKQQLPSQLKSLERKSDTCVETVTGMAKAFHDVLKMTIELNCACSATRGSYEIMEKDAEVMKSYLDSRIKSQEKAITEQEKFVKEMKEAYQESKEMYKTSFNSIPSGGQLLALQTAQTLSEGVSTAMVVGLKAYVNKRAMGGQQMNKALDASLDSKWSAKKPGDTTKPAAPPTTDQTLSKVQQKVEDLTLDNTSGSDVTDPAYQIAQILQDAMGLLFSIVTTGADGGVNWDQVTKEGEGGLRYAKVQFQTAGSGGRLKASTTAPSTEAKQMIKEGVEACDALEARKMDHTEDSGLAELDKVLEKIQNLKDKITKFAAGAVQKTGSSPLQNPGFVIPPIPEDNTPMPKPGPSVVNATVEASQFRVTAAQSQLTANRKMYDKANDKMIEMNDALAELSAQVAKLDAQKPQWDQIRDVLIKAIGFLTELTHHLQVLVDFFVSIRNSVKVTQAEAIEDFRTTVDNATKDVTIAGVAFSDYIKTTIYKQAMVAGKVCCVMERIASLYLQVYRKHIMSGMEVLSKMPVTVDKGTEEAFVAKKSGELKKWAADTQRSLRTFIDSQKDEFDREMDAREEQFKVSFGPLLAPPESATRKAIEGEQKAHLEVVKEEMDKAPSATKRAGGKREAKNL